MSRQPRSASGSSRKQRDAFLIKSIKANRKLVFAFVGLIIGALTFTWMVIHVRILHLSSLFQHSFHQSSSSNQQKPQQPYNPNKPLNVLLLYGDDWRHDSLGLMEGSVVQTPFLDQFVRDEGAIWFTHACVTTSVCWISRASLHTGQYYRRHGSRDTDHPHWYREWNTSTFPALLRKAGWYVGHVGKWNWKYWREVIQHEYDFAQQYEGYHWYALPDKTTKNRDTSNNRKKPKRIHTTKRNQRDAITFLQTRPKDKPFLLTVAFFAPHAEDTHPSQYLPQPKSMHLYLNQTIPLPPPNGRDDATVQEATIDATTSTTTTWPSPELPAFFTERNVGRQRWRQRFDSPRQYQTMMKNYYRLITEVDAACQRIVQVIKEQGILEQTLIIFTTDNGYFHAEHGLADKWYPHEPSIRVPLIIRDPRRRIQRRDTATQFSPAAAKAPSSTMMATTSSGPLVGNGIDKNEPHGSPVICDAFVLNVDVAPTILRAANLSIPARMQGYDLATLYLTNSNTNCGTESSKTMGTTTDEQHPMQNLEWRQEFVYEHPKLMDDPYSIPASEALVRKDWKYVEWPDFGVTQLFDLQHDPYELKDVSSDPQLAALLLEMRARHAELKRQLE